MNFCNHKPEFKLKAMFMRLPQFTCSVCGDRIEMTKPFQIATRIINGILLASIFLVALSTGRGNTAGTADWNRMAIDIGIMLGIAVLYFLVHLLLFRFAKYETVAVPEAKSPAEPMAAAAAAEPQKPVYTAEQLEIMEMYAEAERQSRVLNGEETESAQEPAVTEPEAVSPEIPALDTCSHVPVKSWKNFVPGKFDFICDKCGKPISIPPDVRKKMNLLLMVVSFAILMPSFLDMSVAFWKFGLLSVLVIVISIAIQYFFIRRGRFILRTPVEPRR